MTIPLSPAYLHRRVSRGHPFAPDDRQILAPTRALLTDAEQRRLPPALARLHAHFAARIAAAPAPFAWLADALSGRTTVFECARFDTREYWNIRLTRSHVDDLASICFGCDANSEGTIPASVPRALAWMRETFGTINLVAEQSGTAPMGWTLAEIEARDRVGTASLAAEFPEHTFEDAWTHRRTVLPADASEWVSLYETDGDWLFADITRNETVWLGPEWTGEMATRFAVPWERAAAFVLWRMARLTDPGPLRPVDLRMLAAG